MTQPKPIAHHHEIPIYLKQSDRGSWLQWSRGKVRYGVPASQGLYKVEQVIDAVLELEQTKRRRA